MSDKSLDRSLNHVKWAAWGVADIETLDRQQRRNYLKKVRAELQPYGGVLSPGGSTQTPWYRVTLPDGEGGCKGKVNSGAGAFKRTCEFVLFVLLPAEVTGEHADAGHSVEKI